MTERSLKGKTLFITGGSRGIGRAIALRAARDGANIVIAAKTDTQHAKLEGTIHSVAAEVVKAGGQALACKVDLRNPDEVQAAIEAAVAKFGGIDILVNNASAIQLTGTLDTDIKRFDLMNQVNARGTFIASKLCLPYLLKSKNPHILTLSPPLSMDPIWFKSHVAYTMAKYGMSMTVLGLAEEFKEEGVAVNALWPLTTIATAAVNMLGGNTLMSSSRTEDIMSDSAWYILTSNSRKVTGNFFIDEDLLRSEGITDFSKYSVTPGAELTLDFFIDKNRKAFTGNTAEPSLKPQMTASSEALQGVIQLLEDTASQNNRVRRISALIQYDLKENPRSPAEIYSLDLTQSDTTVTKGKPAKKPDCVIGASMEDLMLLVQGRLDVREAFTSGRVTIRGNLKIAMQLHGSNGIAKL